MLTLQDIHSLASRPERTDNLLLTVYLDVDQSEQANLNRGFEKQLKDMLVSVRDTITSENELRAFRTAYGRVEDSVARYHVGARSLVIVFDASDGFFWSQELDFPIRDQIRWGKEIFVQPLVVAIDEYERVGIVLLDRANLRLFTMFLGEIEEHIREGFDHRKVRHTKTVGMDHMGSSSHAQRKADEQILLNLRHAAKDVDSMFAEGGVNRIILAGLPEITGELKTVLPKRLLSQVIGTVDIATSATIEKIRKAAAPIAEKFERETEAALVADLVTSSAKSGRVVIGLGHTLHALNQSRVWRLVYAGEFRSPGYECPQCAALFSIETSCPFCGSAADRIEDVVERGVEHAIRKGVQIEIIRSEEAESSLINAGGIGAYLRTRTASLRVS
jgi:peptide subunit release factor 1 (eRF1)